MAPFRHLKESDCPAGSSEFYSNVDIVYTWVNGSDPEVCSAPAQAAAAATARLEAQSAAVARQAGTSAESAARVGRLIPAVSSSCLAVHEAAREVWRQIFGFHGRGAKHA